MKKKERKPKFVGSGIYMMMQTFGHPLVKGDTCWDADLGDLIWDGKQWKSKDEIICIT